MKFYCEKCNTKYGIADEKVRGKVLKVRCKRCENVITVREHQAPASKSAGNSRSSAPAPVPPSPTPTDFDPRQVEWHYSVNGQSYGPFTYEDLCQRFGSGELGSECYVWTDSFGNWKPVRQVGAFKEALDRSQKVRPRPKTLGVSQALEAVRPEKFAAKSDKAQPQADRRRQDDPDQPAAAHASPKRGDDKKKNKKKKPLTGGQNDRLAKLRDRLKSRSSKPRPSSKPQPVRDDKPGSAAARPDPAPEQPSTRDVLADGGSEQPDEELDDAADTTLDDEPAALQDEALAPTLPMDDGADDDAGAISGLFDDIDGPAGDDDDQSGLFDGGEADADAEEPADAGEDDDDAIPFFPQAPALASDAAPEKSSTEASGITGSLLIQLDNIQKQGRGKKIALIAAAVLLVGGLTAVAIYVASQASDDEPAVAEEEPEASDSDEKLVIRTYSDDEQNKILMLADQHVDDEAAAADTEDDGKAEADQPTKVAQKSDQGAPDRRVRGAETDENKGPSLKDALNSATARKSDDDNFGRDLDDRVVAKSEMDSPLVDESNSFASASALSSSKRDEPIYKPTESLEKRKKSTGSDVSLTRDQINAGIATIRRSVGICRERHSRRGGPLDARKIYLTVTVEPTGRVSAFDLEPKRLQNSEFQRCMTSHRGRWKFPAFDGSSQQMRAPFVLQ